MQTVPVASSSASSLTTPPPDSTGYPPLATTFVEENPNGSGTRVGKRKRSPKVDMSCDHESIGPRAKRPTALPATSVQTPPGAGAEEAGRRQTRSSESQGQPEGDDGDATMEDGTGEGVETGEEVEIGEVVETDDEEEIDEGDKNKLFKQVRPRISEKDDILLVLRQLQSREYSLPNFQHPVKLPEMSKVKPISAIRIVKAIYDAAPAQNQSEILPLIIQLGEEHRKSFNKVDKRKKAEVASRFKGIEDAVQELSSEYFDGEDLLTRRLIKPSNVDRPFALLVHAYYPPPPAKGQPDREYLFDRGVWTANIWRTFNLHNTSAGTDLYSFETEIPRERSNSAILKDPSLEDKELATSLYDLLSKESLSLQLEAFKKGSITNVIGRVVEKEIEKAVKGQKSLKLIKSSSSLEITGVQRVRDDGSTVSHDSGSVNVDFGFVVDKSNSIQSLLLFGDHTSARSAAGGPSSARTWRRSLVQAGFFNLFNTLAGGKPLSDYDQLCLARQNVPGSDPKAHAFKVDEIRRLDPDISPKSLTYLESNYGGAAQTYKLMNQNPDFTVEEAFSRNGHLMNEAKLAKAIAASGNQKTKGEVQYESAKTASDAATAKLSKGKYWENSEKCFDSTLLTELEKMSKDSKNKLDQRKAKSQVFTEVMKRKFKKYGLPYPRTEEKKPVSALRNYLQIHNQKYLPEYSDFYDFLLQEFGIRIVIDFDARTSADPAKDAALKSVITQCEWIKNGWVSKDFDKKTGLEIIFILAVISTPIVKLVADSSQQHKTSRKERKKPKK